MPRYIGASLCLCKKGEFDKAIADYTEAIRLDPKYAEAHEERGYSYHKKGELRQGHC